MIDSCPSDSATGPSSIRSTLISAPRPTARLPSSSCRRIDVAGPVVAIATTAGRSTPSAQIFDIVVGSEPTGSSTL